ncbi:hypothetical protein AAVH_14146 [Aphelenchoides avenae]|nr:hypothetical protein AAVH_14146 [Aphelenchus avenae]
MQEEVTGEKADRNEASGLGNASHSRKERSDARRDGVQNAPGEKTQESVLESHTNFSASSPEQ